ncbi:hypothetical protein PZ938_19910 [Luteipulveratus sp. YIM 133132]|uniref:hypothetical protein n=1 Tax=Luteipulveratus flavus TaxID=3031728 RepID=UPI0023B02A1C|nr:hypothetical protein [Luteipulveratus sp. YIM 133132]MDE9367888.1 hypothetical protein [Luteipulveratus sp. YIM 133132]
MKIARVGAGGIALSVMLLGAGAGAADAVNWVPFRTSSNPLGKTHNGTTVWTYGDWEVLRTSTGDKSHGSPRIRTTNPSGYKGYVTMVTATNSGLCYAPEYTSRSQPYYDYQRVDTYHTNSNSYVLKHTYTNLASSGNFARGRFYATVDVPNRPDPQSGAAFSYTGKPY